MQSFKSKEYVRETFAWMHYYWYLTNDGIEFLQTYLNRSSENVPATLKKSVKTVGEPIDAELQSKEYIRETFAWMHYYWYLTNDGIEFLYTYLNLPSEIVPATLKKSVKPVSRPMDGPPRDQPQ
ncbi:hypothetical protein HHK36_026977 [Tetracentron sinense]|uniref:Plectin/eS10 N-terminal domain-containing protein n=1 Tax=Tetracentron sinense TaxID=13715 RepID=A0A834YMC8_TETSI|nr:hypothetical protein HHK36_026977 [Tetracentron sinense]